MEIEIAVERVPLHLPGVEGYVIVAGNREGKRAYGVAVYNSYVQVVEFTSSVYYSVAGDDFVTEVLRVREFVGVEHEALISGTLRGDLEEALDGIRGAGSGEEFAARMAALTTFTVVGESLPPKVATALSVAQITLFAYCVERYGHEFREALENAFGSPGEFL